MYTKKTDCSIFGEITRYYKNGVEIGHKRNGKMILVKIQPCNYLDEKAIYRILKHHNSTILQECVNRSGYIETIDKYGFIPIVYYKDINKKIPVCFHF